MVTAPRKFLTDSAFQLGSRTVGLLRGLILLPAFADGVGKSGYGVYTQAMVTVTLLAPVASLRLEAAVIRFIAAETDPDRIRRRFYSALGGGMTAAAALAFVPSLFPRAGASAIFGDPSLGKLISEVGLLLFTTVLVLFLGNYLRARQRIKLQSVFALCQGLSEMLVVWLLLRRGHQVSGALLGLIAVQASFAVLLLVAVGRDLGWPRFERRELSSMLRYSGPLVPNGLLRWSVNYADRLVLVQLINISAVGVYAASYTLASTINILVMPVGAVLFPVLSKTWDQGRPDEARAYLSNVTRAFLLLGFPACAGLAVVGDPVIGLLAGPSFSPGPWLVFWIAAGALCNGLFQLNVYTFHLTRRTGYITLILALASGTNVALNLSLVPRLGIVGAAVATFVAFFLMAAGALIAARRLLAYSIDVRSALKAALAATAMAAVVGWMPAAGWSAVLARVAVGAVIYVVLLWSLRTLSAADIEFIKQLLGGRSTPPKA